MIENMTKEQIEISINFKENRGDNDLWKTNISEKGEDKIAKRFNYKK